MIAQYNGAQGLKLCAHCPSVARYLVGAQYCCCRHGLAIARTIADRSVWV